MSEPTLEFGPQPLDNLVRSRSWSNHDLVAASDEHLTHKMVRKGRRGRRLTRNVQGKILNACNALADDSEAFTLGDLFNYRGR